MPGWTVIPGGDSVLKIALAGFSQGYYATTYMRYLVRLKEMQPVAVCDCNASVAYVQECAFVTAEAFARELGVPLVHDYDELLQYRPDAVLICSETADHTVMARKALERGIHVFVSKPLGFSLDQITQLHETAGSPVLLCGNPLKYEQGLMEMQARLAAGEIGQIYSLRLMINHLAMTQQTWERDETRSGGPLGTYGVYLFDLARWMTAQPLRQLYAMADNYCTPDIRTPDTVKILGKGEAGAQFTLELYSAIRHEYPFVQAEAIGEKGTLITQYGNYATLAQTDVGSALGTLRVSDMGAGEMEHFLACVQGRETVRCSFSDMEYVVRCLEATRKSITLYEAVKIDGGNAWQAFRHITMTGIKNVSITTILLEIIWTFNKFDLVYTMTKGGPSNSTQTIPVYTYITAFNFFKFNKAAAVGVIGLLVVGVFAVLYIIYNNREEAKGA